MFYVYAKNCMKILITPHVLPIKYAESDPFIFFIITKKFVCFSL